MRPEILNPLFAEVEVLKGVGPALAKPLKRLGVERGVEVLFHLPTGWIERKRVEIVDMADAGSVVTVLVTPVDYRQGGPRSPFRVHATDRAGNYLTLTYFNNPGWAKKQLPIGEPKVVSGRMENYGQELQIVHPDYVLPPAEALDLPVREPVYALSEGLTNTRDLSFPPEGIPAPPSPKTSPTAEWAISPRRRWRGGPSSASGSSRAC